MFLKFQKLRKSFVSRMDRRIDKLSDDHEYDKGRPALYAKASELHEKLENILSDEYRQLFSDYFDAVGYIILDRQQYFYRLGISESNPVKQLLVWLFYH
jgi:hypothetical protein